MDTHNNQTASNAATIPDHTGEHERKLTLHCDYWLPNHAEPRTASPTYVRAHHHLVKVLDTPCYICGSKEERQTHHRLEHCFAEALDWTKVAADYPDFDWLSFDQTKPENWLDSEHNLIVLCMECHIGERGVHRNPWPEWIAQRYLRSGYQEF